MLRRFLPLCSLLFVWWMMVSMPREQAVQAAPAVDGPSYTADGQLKFPDRYREWVFLTSGVDMSYDKKAGAAEHTMFNNVFVNPSGTRRF